MVYYIFFKESRRQDTGSECFMPTRKSNDNTVRKYFCMEIDA